MWSQQIDEQQRRSVPEYNAIRVKTVDLLLYTRYFKQRFAKNISFHLPRIFILSSYSTILTFYSIRTEMI